MFLGRFGFIGKHKVVRECKAEVEGDIVFKTFLNKKNLKNVYSQTALKKKTTNTVISEVLKKVLPLM